MDEALADYRRAAELDSNFALAYPTMAEAYVNMSNFGYVSKTEAVAIADPFWQGGTTDAANPFD